MIDRFRAAVAVASLCLTVSAAAAGKLELATQPLLVIASDTPTATGTIKIRNAGDAKVEKPELVVEPFFSDPGNEPLAVTAKLTLPAAIDIGATVDVPVELSNVTEPGYAKAELRSGATSLGNLRVVKKVFPFNVAPVGYDAKQPFPVHLVQGRPASITLLNSDPYSHSLSWSLRDADRELATGSVPLLRPNATADIRIPAESGGLLRWLEGTLLAPQSPGRLLLRATPRGAAQAGEYWAAKDVPLQLQRTAGAGAGRDLRQLGLILLLLLAGGLTSLYLTYWVPNTLRKMDIKGQIEELTSKIHLLRRTPSSLRVLLGVLRNQIRARVDAKQVLSIDFATVAAECEQRAKALARRIELVQRVEYLLIDIEREWESGTMLGPTVLIRAARLLQKAGDQLEQNELTEDDLRALETQVAQVAETLRSIAEDPKLVQEVVARAVELQKRKGELQPLVTAAMELAPALAISKVEEVVWPTGFWKLDYAVTKMDVAASVPAASWQQVLRFLRLHSLDAFERAASEARQIGQETFPDKLKTALESKEVEIDFHPERATANALVSFELRLRDPGLNGAAARETFTCRWDFGDGLHEVGWRVSHYFWRPGRYEVKPTVRDANGSPVELDPVFIEVRSSREELVGARTRIEWIRLGVALLIVLLGLVAGAKEQLAKLDFVPALIALFLLGVSADQIKNLLAPKTP